MDDARTGRGGAHRRHRRCPPERVDHESRRPATRRPDAPRQVVAVERHGGVGQLAERGEAFRRSGDGDDALRPTDARRLQGDATDAAGGAEHDDHVLGSGAAAGRDRHPPRQACGSEGDGQGRVALRGDVDQRRRRCDDLFSGKAVRADPATRTLGVDEPRLADRTADALDPRHVRQRRVTGVEPPGPDGHVDRIEGDGEHIEHHAVVTSAAGRSRVVSSGTAPIALITAAWILMWAPPKVGELAGWRRRPSLQAMDRQHRSCSTPSGRYESVPELP